MKPDGVTMETTEPTEAAAVAEPLNPPDNSSAQASHPPEPPETSGPSTTAATVNGTDAGAKPKSAAAATKKQPLSKTESGYKAGVTTKRPVGDVRPNSVNQRAAPGTKTFAPSSKQTGAATVLKKPLGGASAAKTQVKIPDKKPSGQTAAANEMTNGTKPANSTPKKTLAVKPRTTAPQARPTGPAASKSGTSSSTKPNAVGPIKSSRPATAPASLSTAKASTAAAATKPSSIAKTAASRAASASAAAGTTKPLSTAKTAASRAASASAAAGTTKPLSTAKTAASRAATAPSSGRTAAAQPNKATVPAKKDVGRPPPSAAVPKKPATTSPATKKPESSKTTVNFKSRTASAKVDLKPPLHPQPTKSNAIKKPAAAAARFPAVNRVGQTPPGSPVNKNTSVTNAARAKQALKPNQAVPSPGKKPEKMGASKAEASASTKADVTPVEEASANVAPMTAAPILQELPMEHAASLIQGLSLEATEAVNDSEVIYCTFSENLQKQTESNTVSTPQSPMKPASPQTEQQQLGVLPPPTDAQVSGEPSVSPVDLVLKPDTFVIETQKSHSPKPPVAENGSPQVIPPCNLNDDEEEEEKEGSQQVSVSEMSGTTQPTEESRPGSAGPGPAWRVGGALLSELDSEEVSVSQQGASELSAPGVLEGTESMDDLGEGSLKGAMDMEGASVGSPDFEKVPEIPVNDYDDDEDEDDNDRVCDMDVGSERADEPQRLRHDNDVEDEDEDDEDVEMASEGVTESGLESYGNADEDDFAEDERLDNLNRVAQPPPPPPLLPSAPAAQWDQPNPFIDPWAEPILQQPDFQSGQGAEAADDSPLTDPCQGDSETPTQEPAETWLELGSAAFVNENQTSSCKNDEQIPESKLYLEHPCADAEPSRSSSVPCASTTAPLSSGSGSPDKINFEIQRENLLVPMSEPAVGGEPEGLPVDVVLVSGDAPGSNPSSSSVTEDEASDMEGEAQLEDSLETPVICDTTFEAKSHGTRCLSTVEEAEEAEDTCAAEDATPPSATSQVSYGFDTMTSASNSNAQSTGESCVKSPGIFSLEELSEEAKEPPALPGLPEQPYIESRKGEADCQQTSENDLANSDKLFSPSEPQQLDQEPPHDDIQTPYYSAICEKTENSFAGFSSLLHPQRRDHSSYPRTYCDIVKPVNAALASPKLSCADLPPRSPKQQPLSPQLRRLEQHQRHLLEMQQRREQQSRPLEEAEQERKRREEEEERKKKDEAEEEIKRNREVQEKRLREEAEDAKRRELEERKVLELQLHQQQEELKQRQQIMQWQQELQESNKGQPLLLSPSSGLCTIYESLENSDEEDGPAKCEEETMKELNPVPEMSSETVLEVDDGCGKVTPESLSTHISQDIQQRLSPPPQNGDSSSTPSDSPERPSPLDLDWGKKVDIVHQLINQTLLLNGDGCSSLLLLPGGAGGTLSPLESSLWPSLLPPLTPPSATVTSVSSFSPETSGSSPQGEWTVVELETHH